MNESKSGSDLSLFIANLTSKPGVYRMLDSEGTVLYVGKATNLKKRVSSYFNKQQEGAKTRSLVSQIAAIDVSVTNTETEALLLESTLIKSLRPKYNVLMRDDKSYPYLYVSTHQTYPRMHVMRSKKKPKTGTCFGPYPSTTAVRETLVIIEKVFKLRNCNDSFFNARSRPCLQYQIKRCTAPCVNYISAADYQQSVRDALRFLQGKCQQVLDELTARMDECVSRLAYEEAAVLRDQIKSLRMVQEQQGVVSMRGDADVICFDAQAGFACVQCVSIRDGQVMASQTFFPKVPANVSETLLRQQVFEAFVAYYYLDTPERIPALLIVDDVLPDLPVVAALLTELRGKICRIQTHVRGVKERWLEFTRNNLHQAVAEHASSSETLAVRYHALQTILNLPASIGRMECFDISHTQGTSTVASCVVFDKDGPQKAEYRQFNIEGITPGDDYAAMEQALTRRFKRLLQQQNLPDVLIIDGGKGQVSVALRVLQTLGIDQVYLLGIAKGPGRKAGWEKLVLVTDERELSLPEDSPALHLLQHIRDEAHRFAIAAHRKKRQKSSLTSTLESIEGVGPKRRQALLKRFGGLREIARATAEELAKVQGISMELALRIFEHFH